MRSVRRKPGKDILHRDTGAVLLHVPARTLEGAVLAGAQLSQAKLCSEPMMGVVLRGADLSSADLRHADLRQADLSGADLRDAALCYADLREAILNGANLEGADLDFARLEGAVLTHAHLDADPAMAYATYDALTKWPRRFVPEDELLVLVRSGRRRRSGDWEPVPTPVEAKRRGRKRVL